MERQKGRREGFDRNKKREEMAQDSVFVPILYGPDMSNPEGDMMGGGMPM